MSTAFEVFAIGMPGPMEWVIILVVLLLFGGSRIPTLMRSLGQGLNEFKRGLKDGDSSSVTSVPSAEEPADSRR
jgi:sec-independent protein translocase protein TatA